MAEVAIQTERLDLIPLSPVFIEALLAGRRSEAEQLLDLHLPNDWPNEHDARFLRMRLGQLQADREWQRWLVRAIVLRSGRSMIGHIGFHGPPETVGRAEMGYTVFPRFRRRGYATEAATGMMEWASAQNVNRFFLSISPNNEPSLAMASKLGFKHVGEQMDEEDGLEFVFELIAGDSNH